MTHRVHPAPAATSTPARRPCGLPRPDDSRQQRHNTAYGHASPGTEVVSERPDDRGADRGTADEGQHVEAHDATAQLRIDGELDGGVCHGLEHEVGEAHRAQQGQEYGAYPRL